MTEDHLFVKKTYATNTWITVFLHDPFGTMDTTDINITFQPIDGNCPKACRGSATCNNEQCSCPPYEIMSHNDGI